MSDVAGPLMEALEKAPMKKIIEVRESVIEEAGKHAFNGGIQTSWENFIVNGVKE